MQKICLTILLGVLFSQSGLAQQSKTEILVYGSGPGAIAAGIQAARSGVKTLLVTENTWQWDTNILDNPQTLQYGIWVEFAKNCMGSKDKTSVLPEKINLKSDSALKTLKLMCDTVKRLSLLNNSSIQSAKKTGSGWEIRLSNGKKIKATVLVDASSDHRLLKQLQSKLAVKTDTTQTLFRTSVAALDASNFLPLASLIAEKTENVLGVPAFNSAILAMHAGQAAGATAAYCAFFKTSTKNLNVRAIQSELLTYHASLIPFGDVFPSDSNFVKIQHVALSGLMDAGIRMKNGVKYWMPENTLSGDELKEPMKSFYSRSQIWFADHRTEKITIAQTIDLLMYTATRGEELKKEIIGGWKNYLGFKTNFETERPITRWEFALLLDTYLQPFSVRVDLQGQLLN